MTTVYFIRHAEPNYQNRNDALRELSAKGLRDRQLVTAFLADKNVDAVLSSPYRRAVDTVRDLAEKRGLDVVTEDAFRERRIDGGWIEDFDAFSRAQWSDFSYKLPDGESLGEVQARNIAALEKVLEDYRDKTVVIGSHGTALSTVINYYDASFGYADFEKIRGVMPWCVQFVFEGKRLTAMRTHDLFAQETGD